jgi:molybdopterin-guanine dinucleotide biosynthesis protein A
VYRLLTTSTNWPWRVRQAGPEDAPLLAALGSRLFQEAFAKDNRPEDMARYVGENFAVPILLRELQESGGHMLLLEQDGEPVGWAHLRPSSADGRGHHPFEIRRFYVDGRWHGTGAAAALLSAVLQQARATGADAVWLGVWEHNRRAQAFYGKHGFAPVGRQPFQLGSDVQTDDVLLRPASFGLTLAIVAGGSARRLGGIAKPLLRVEGRPILDRLLDLAPLADEVLLVSSDTRFDGWGLRRIEDVLPDHGAPGGVHAALSEATQAWVLAVAGDMPFASGLAALPLLAARSEEVDAVAYTVAGRLEPLLALYRRSLARSWAAALGTGAPSFRDLWETLRGRQLGEDVLRGATGDLRAVTSLNTPEDIARWVQGPPMS